eukprot:364253-Chlamydomonas_euryale.AAC.1
MYHSGAFVAPACEHACAYGHVLAQAAKSQWILPNYGGKDCKKDYDIGKILGKGSFGTTYLAVKKGTDKTCAIKVCASARSCVCRYCLRAVPRIVCAGYSVVRASIEVLCVRWSKHCACAGRIIVRVLVAMGSGGAATAAARALSAAVVYGTWSPHPSPHPFLSGVSPPSTLPPPPVPLPLLGSLSSPLLPSPSPLTHRARVVQVVSKRKLTTPEEVEDMRGEVQILHHLSGHPNVVNVLDVYEDKYNVCIAMDLCTGGELFDAIVARGSYSEKVAAA